MNVKGGPFVHFLRMGTLTSTSAAVHLGTALILTRRPAQACAAVTPTDFGRSATVAIVLAHRVPVPRA